MSGGSSPNHLFQNIKDSFFYFLGVPKEGDIYGDLVSNSKPKYDDEVMECLQFGICDLNTRPLKEIPYFHF
tara:strand:- start:379 stop:591 length:213 start_codon:yes stop_codon:yes gene_type:complete